MATRKKRPGRTKTTSFSLDEETLRSLKVMAHRAHGGNVSALITEFATREAKLAAADAFFEKHGVPPHTDAEIAAIEAEWAKADALREERPARRARSRRAA